MTDRAPPTESTDRTELLELARDLVSIPSHDEETRAGEYVERWLGDQTDARVRRDAAGNVLARRALGESVDADGSDADPTTLALVGHHDVVPPDDPQIVAEDDAGDERGEYVLEERDGRLYGRGTADMKGALAAAMCAFRDASSEGGSERADQDDTDPVGKDSLSIEEFLFASFVGEELGGVGARGAIDRGFSPEYAIVGEGSTGYSAPGVTDVAVAHKGRRASTITASGEAAHASEPGEGINAIYRACEAIDAIGAIDAPTVEIAGENVAGSVVVTEIEGGAAWNTVPDSCALTIDERTVPGERAPLERIEDIEGVSWKVEQDLPPMRCGSKEFAETVLEAATEAQGHPPRLVTKPHATDAGWLAEAGTACVVCGPAEPGEAHTDTESVSIDVLERCYRIYRATVEAMS